MGDLSMYKTLLRETFARVSTAVGVHVMLLVVEHAIWKTKQQHEAAGDIIVLEDGVSLDCLDRMPPEVAGAIARDFILAIVSTLGRLVGKQVASQLTEELNVGEKEA